MHLYVGQQFRIAKSNYAGERFYQCNRIIYDISGGIVRWKVALDGRSYSSDTDKDRRADTADVEKWIDAGCWVPLYPEHVLLPAGM